jgi:hypothetical protein
MQPSFFLTLIGLILLSEEVFFHGHWLCPRLLTELDILKTLFTHLSFLRIALTRYLLLMIICPDEELLLY